MDVPTMKSSTNPYPALVISTLAALNTAPTDMY